MFLTVTLNPALDKLLGLPGFAIGGVHTPETITVLPGGKGINVARQLHRLGETVRATGIIAGFTGQAVVAGLDDEGLTHDFVEVPGESRTCIALFDAQARISTEVNETGPFIGPEHWAQFTRRLSHHLADAVGVVFAGRLPPGVPVEAYGELIELARNDGKLVALDTVEPALRHGLAAGPTVAKPNQDEAEAFLGYSLNDRQVWAKALDTFLEFGLEAVAITMGSAGALIGVRQGDQRHWHVSSPEVTVVSAIGCGDAFLGAWLSAHLRGQDWVQAALWASAAGAANSQQLGSGLALPDQITPLVGHAFLTPIAP